MCHVSVRGAPNAALAVGVPTPTEPKRPPPLASAAELPVKLQPRTMHDTVQPSCNVTPPPPPPVPAFADDASAGTAANKT